MRMGASILIAAVLVAAPQIASAQIIQWVHHDGHQYGLTEPMTWTDAEVLAVSMGGHLATINDAAEESAVFTAFDVANLNEVGNGAVYIGFNDITSEGDFEWVSGEPVTYTNWQSGEPNDHPGSPPNCQFSIDPGEDATMMGWGGTPRWWDAPICYTTYHAIIELDCATSPWTDLGNGLAGTHGEPRLEGIGDLTCGEPVGVTLTQALENAAAYLAYGFTELNAPLYGGTLVPDVAPPGGAFGLATNPAGEISVATTWPAGVPEGFTFYVQCWVVDPSGPQGFAASNGLEATVLPPSPCDVIIEEDFDAYAPGTSVGDIPGFTSSDGSGEYDKDGLVLSDFVVADTAPNHARLVGYPSTEASFTLHVGTPEPMTSLVLSFAYEFQPNAIGRVEVAASPSGPFVDAGLQLERDCNNDLDKIACSDLASALVAAGVSTDAYIRWTNEAPVTNCVVFNVDTIRVVAKTTP